MKGTTLMRQGLTALFILSLSYSFSQNCNSIPPLGDFNVEILERDASGNAYDIDVSKAGEVFWVERNGAFKVHNQNSGNTTLIRNMPVSYDRGNWERGNEGGLVGIALDPDFANNNWVYLMYGVQVPNVVASTLGPIERVSRFTLTNNNTQIDMNSEKIIWQHTIFAQCCHHGGDLLMEDDGTLWITTGDNINPSHSNSNPRATQENRDVRHTSGNTNDYRGKVLRIRVNSVPDNHGKTDWGVGKTYTIPEGNLREKYSSLWNAADQAKVKPEIYTMGHRNPFSIAVHSENQWLGIGEASGGSGEDEVNMATEAGNYGWPYFSGKNVSYNGNFNPNDVTNSSPNNTGASKLPPAKGSIDQARGGWCLGEATAFISFDSTLVSDVKFPPAMHGVLLGGGYFGAIKAYSFNSQGELTNTTNMWSGANVDPVHRGIQGPDGALYLAVGQLTFGNAANSRITKISYTGTCNPEPVEVAARRMTPEGLINHSLKLVSHGLPIEILIPNSARKAVAYDVNGANIWQFTRTNSEGVSYQSIPENIAKGILTVKFYQ